MKKETNHRRPVYSICMTCRNASRTIERSLTSVLSQLDDTFEVIVVDGGSDDGTVEAAKGLQRKYGKLTLVSHPCSRGLGRDIAYRLSKGKYLIQQVDADVIYRPTLRSILDYYHSQEKILGQYALQVAGAFLICPRDLMDRIGGWPDLQFAEDPYVYNKLARVCNYEHNRSLQKVAVEEHIETSVGRRISLAALVESYIIWRDFHRMLPLPQAFEILRLILAEEQWIVRKLGHMLMFCLGTLGQYSKVRYKLSGEDLQSYMWGERFVRTAEKSLESRGILYDVMFNRTKAASPRILRRGSTNDLSRA